ncbi:hypothetical protein DLAC_06892 [Tieghemostelium lacteum]|uniref:GOST seven transmembrane domain-containing protein n=1 Tax=Tieghemostelium lacteum TaxID=361077 RepID=A0A151ZDP8_TIELA|nr:hypothetical protein DLAC_06892 [Tieghemostelium lacteum]|eukprot:KYQ92055.1 hypothetical protein DLAC_06892 [Tieghemostelium lacteum]
MRIYINTRNYLLLLVLMVISNSNYRVECSIWPITYTSQIAIDSPGSVQVPPGTWSNQSPGNGRSFIQVDANLTVPNPDTVDLVNHQASVDIIILKNSESSSLGTPVASSSVLCCSQTLIQQGKCTNLGSAILRNANYTMTEYDDYIDVHAQVGNVQTHHIVLTKISSIHPVVNVPLMFNVTEKGLYNVIAISCWKYVSPQSSTEISISGTLTFMNPFGYLSANLFPTLYSNLVISLLYVLLGVLWLIYCYKYKNTLLYIHYWIALSIVLGFLESIVDYGTLSKWNKIGEFSVTGLVFTTLIGTLKRAFGRSLVLLVAMGYSIVVPTISKANKIKVIGLTVLYFVTRGIQYFIENYPTPSNAAEISYIFLTLPVSILDACFYWLIFLSFMSTMETLKNNNQSIKLQMYKNFLYILVYYAVIVVILVIIQMIMNWACTIDTIATATWVFEIVWDYTYFSILLAICKIWRPSENNQKYAYSEINLNDGDMVIHSIGDDDDNGQIESIDDNIISMTPNEEREQNKNEILNSFFKL